MKRLPTRRSIVSSGLASALAPLAPASARAEDGADVLIGRIALDAERVRTSVTIGGKGPFSFIIDTGAAASGIDETLAHDLGLPDVGRRRVRGYGGPGLGEVTLYQARNVVLGGGMAVPNVGFTGFPGLKGSRGGLLAASVFTAYDTDIDFLNQQLRIYPHGRPPLVDHVRLDATVDSAGRGAATRLIVKATLDGWTGRFLLDTGAPSAISLEPHAPVSRRYWSDERPFALLLTGGILGRDIAPSRLVRAEKLELGPLTMLRPLVVVRSPNLPADIGGGADRLDGVIGLSLIRQLNLAFDTGRHAIWVQPSGLPNPPEPSYSHTGLWLQPLAGDVGRARITAVSPKSPAAAAGLKAGEIVQMDKRPGAPQHPGEGQLDLIVERGGEAVPLVLKPRPYL